MPNKKISIFIFSLLLSPLCVLAQLYNDLPEGFPEFEVTVFDNPSPGYYFMSGTYFGNELREYAIILDTLGFTVFYQKHNPDNNIQGFRLQDNGLLSYSTGSGTDISFNVIDSTYQLVENITPLNGYPQDPHELIIESDGSYWLLAYDVREYDMSQVVQGGQENALVMGCLIQHIDEAQNLLFEWSSWDHMEIADCDPNFVDLTQNVIDWVHANSLAFDFDGNVLLSCRNMNEITKIDVTTGEIIWRWGGINNQFTFEDPQDIFYGQHTIRYHPETNTYTLFDNGNFHMPPHSSGKEFELDQEDLLANCIHVFDHEPVIYISAMGGLQRLSNGSTIVNWTRSNSILSEYDEQGEIIFEIAYVDSLFQSYRVEKYEWKTSLFDYQEEEINFENISIGGTITQQLTVVNNQAYEVIINGYDIVNPVFSLETELPVTLGPNASETFAIAFSPLIHKYYEGILSLFHSTDTSRVAQQIRLRGSTIVGTNELTFSARNDIVISPNPASDHVFIELPAGMEAISIEIYSIKGKLVIHEELKAEHFSLDVGHLPAGLYVIRILSNEGLVLKKLLVC